MARFLWSVRHRRVWRTALLLLWSPLVAAAVLWPWAVGLLLVGTAGVAFVAHSQRDAVSLLTAYVVVLFGVSARYVFAPLGEVGTLAVVTGVMAAGLWGASRVVLSLGGARGPQPVRLAVLALWWCMLAGYVAAQLRPLTVLEASGADRMAIKMIALGGIALVAADGIESRARLEVLLKRLVVAGVALALIGILQFTTGIDLAASLAPPGFSLNADLGTIGERADFRRVAGTALHAIEYGVVLTTLLPIAVSYAMTAKQWWRQLTWYGCAAIIGVAIPMSVSRSAVVGLAIGMLALFPVLDWSRRLFVVVGGAVFAVLLRSALPGLLGTIKALFVDAGTDPSIQTRTMDYVLVQDYFAQSPWFGRGLGTFLPSLYDFLDNQFLLTLVETGVVGLLSLVALIVVACSVARGVRRRGRDADTRFLGQALTAALLASAFNFTTFDALSFPINAGLFFLLAGCAGALWRLEAGPGTAGARQDLAEPWRAVPAGAAR